MHKSMDGVVSRWAAMPTGIMRPDFVRTMDDRIEQAYVECINLQGQQVRPHPFSGCCMLRLPKWPLALANCLWSGLTQNSSSYRRPSDITRTAALVLTLLHKLCWNQGLIEHSEWYQDEGHDLPPICLGLSDGLAAQEPTAGSIKQVLSGLTAIRRELRQLHCSPSASRPLSKVCKPGLWARCGAC